MSYESDATEINHQLNLLRTYRRNARLYAQQLALMGGPGYALPQQINGMRESLRYITDIIRWFTDHGYNVQPDKIDMFDLTPYEGTP